MTPKRSHRAGAWRVALTSPGARTAPARAPCVDRRLAFASAGAWRVAFTSPARGPHVRRRLIDVRSGRPLAPVPTALARWRSGRRSGSLRACDAPAGAAPGCGPAWSRAPVWGTGERRFKSAHPDENSQASGPVVSTTGPLAALGAVRCTSCWGRRRIRPEPLTTASLGRLPSGKPGQSPHGWYICTKTRADVPPPSHLPHPPRGRPAVQAHHPPQTHRLCPGATPAHPHRLSPGASTTEPPHAR